MKLDVYFVGVGGQGVLTMADILMQASLSRDIPCNFYPTKGMAQRGGFVKAQLRFGDGACGPEIGPGGADVVIAMEQSEALKAIDYLKPDGDMIVLGYRWLPTDVMLGRAAYPDAERLAQEAARRTKNYWYLDSALVPENGSNNIFLLSAAQKMTALSRLFSAEELKNVIFARFPKGIERNRLSFERGQTV
ncbi:MAG: 2-oxoacid:acceptor oxidoreductase family protein [Candidatus Pelethousia sp.]|nr:2-oxoacid:acceptor oxidoreductase family protein [Candidatus Pelethousia sp.]